MRPIRTALDLAEELDKSVAWRKKEITTFSGQVRKTKELTQTALLRGAVPVLYAHWEGFCKSAFSAYMNFISHQGLRYEELHVAVFAFTQRTKLSAFASQGFGSDHVQIVEDLLLTGHQSARVPYKPTDIQTESNLSYRVLAKLYLSAGLDVSNVEAEKQLIDGLVAKRNEVAHGETTVIDLDYWLEVSEKTRSLLDQVRTDIENAAALGSYRR